jgi:hypothetical protein
MSSFRKLFQAQEEEGPIAEPAEPTEPAKPTAPTPAPPPSSKAGRAKGKRSDPDYTQVGAYIPKALDRAVKKKLIDTDQDFSELVAELLAAWVAD